MTLYINNKKVKFTGASGGIEKIDDILHKKLQNMI